MPVLQAELLREERARSELQELTLHPQISGMAQRLKAAEGDAPQPAWQRLTSRKADKVQARMQLLHTVTLAERAYVHTHCHSASTATRHPEMLNMVSALQRDSQHLRAAVDIHERRRAYRTR